jgi:hypothetical protein
MISVCPDKNIAWPLLWRVTCISTKNEDGGHFIPFDQNICRSKQDMKKPGKRVLYIVIYSLRNSFKWENKKIYCHFPLSESDRNYLCLTSSLIARNYVTEARSHALYILLY